MHHHAMPWQILLAIVTLALSWGWLEVSAALALAWGGMLRIGEVLQARRKHLLMPIDYLLYSIHEPKTRFRGARHQSVKVDQPDIMRIVILGFGGLQPHDKFWPASSPYKVQATVLGAEHLGDSFTWEDASEVGLAAQGQVADATDHGDLRAGGSGPAVLPKPPQRRHAGLDSLSACPGKGRVPWWTSSPL